jgi:hypothetical protein
MLSPAYIYMQKTADSEEKICDTVAVTGEECLELIPGIVVADYVR